jgi:uncharacterized membrane protein
MEKTKLLVSDCIKFGWNTFKARPWFFVITVVIYAIVQVIVGVSQEGIIGFLVSILLPTLLYAGIIHVYLKAHDNVSSPRLNELWNPKPFLNYLLLSILLGIIVLVGLVLLIVPGIIFALMFSMAGFLVVEKGMGPIEALKESARLTKGSRWKLFLLGLALTGLTILGIIPLMLGLFVVVPLSMLALVHAYRTLTGAATVNVREKVEMPAPAPAPQA